MLAPFQNRSGAPPKKIGTMPLTARKPIARNGAKGKSRTEEPTASRAAQYRSDATHATQSAAIPPSKPAKSPMGNSNFTSPAPSGSPPRKHETASEHPSAKADTAKAPMTLDVAVDNIDSMRFDEHASANSKGLPGEAFIADEEVAPLKTRPTALDGSWTKSDPSITPTTWARSEAHHNAIPATTTRLGTILSRMSTKLA